MTIEFNTDNEAFEDGTSECARILRDIADRVEAGQPNGTIRDINGNRVGRWTFSPY